LWLYVVPSAARGVGEDERRRRYVSHLGDELSLASVVGNPFRVEVGLAWGESPVDGFAVDLGGPLPVGSVQLWGVCVAATAELATAVVPRRQVVAGDVSDVGKLAGQLTIVSAARS